MRKRICAMVLLIIMLTSVFSITATAEIPANETPAFEKDGRGKRTLNLSEHNGEEFTYYTSGSSKNPNDKVTCSLVGEWVTVFDPEVGYSEEMNSFFVPDGVFADNVTFTGGAKLFNNVDGYEWRCGRFVVSAEKPTYIIFGFYDYFTDAEYDESKGSNFVYKQKSSGDGYNYGGTFVIENDGVAYDNCFGYCDVTYLKESGKYLTVTNMFYRVPVGYDNCVLGILDTRNFSGEKADGAIDADATGLRGASDYYFRMK